MELAVSATDGLPYKRSGSSSENPLKNASYNHIYFNNSRLIAFNAWRWTALRVWDAKSGKSTGKGKSASGFGCLFNFYSYRKYEHEERREFTDQWKIYIGTLV